MSEMFEQRQEMKRAVKDRDIEKVRSLLAENPHLATLTGKGWTPLQDATFVGGSMVLDVMLVHGVGISAADVAHALHHAVQLPHDNPETIEILLRTGLVSNLFAALYLGDTESVASLISADESLVHRVDAEGYPPLVRAAENGHRAMVELFLERGADIEARGPHSKSALASCVCNQVDRKKRSRTLECLLERGADVNGVIYGGCTPLFSAATAGWHPEEPVRILLDHGADPNRRNRAGRTALDEVLVLKSASFQRVAQMLREGGAIG